MYFQGARDPEQTSTIKIQVLYGQKKYNFNLSEDLKPVYKVKDLKKKCCEYWGYPNESIRNLHLTHQMLVYSTDELLYNIYISVFEGISDMSFSLHLHHVENINKYFLVKDINLNNNRSISRMMQNNKDLNKNNTDYFATEDEFDFLKSSQIYNSKHKNTNFPSSKSINNNDPNNNYLLYNEGSGYASEFNYYLDEVLINEKASEFVLGNDELAARLKQEEKRISAEFEKNLGRKRQQEKEDGYDEDEEEKAERLKMEFYDKAEEIERGLESYKFRYYSSLRKLSEIIVTQYGLFLFRLRNFATLIFYVIFIFFLFSESNLQDAENSFIIEIGEVIKKRIFANKFYSNFLTLQIYNSDEFTPNFFIESKRDFNMFFRFVLNNILSKNNSTIDKISSYDDVDKNGYNLVNTVKFTAKYGQLNLRPRDTLDQNFFSGLYPISDEISEVNDITSNFDLKISDLLNNKIIQEKDVKRIFPNINTETNGKKLAYSFNEPELLMERVLRSYSKNGYQFYLNFKNFEAYKYDYFSGQIIRYIISKPNFKYLKMSMSFYNPALNSMININLIIEVLSVGFFASSLDLIVINIPNNSTSFFYIFSFSKLYAIFFLFNFLLKLLFCVFAEKRIKSDKTLISRKLLLYDFVCILLYIVFVTLEKMASSE